MNKPQTDLQPTHWTIGEEIAQKFLKTNSTAEKETIAAHCQEQGILAGIVCLYLNKQAPHKAREFIKCMIANIEE